MHFLTPHKANKLSFSPIRFEYKIQQEVLNVKFFISLDEANLNKDFSETGFENVGLWDFDVAEVFLTRSETKLPYLELQISPLGQKFSLIVKEPRKITERSDPQNSTLKASYLENEFYAEFNIDLNDIPGEGNTLYGNFFSCLGPSENRCYFAWNINSDEVADYHRPELFKELGDCL